MNDEETYEIPEWILTIPIMKYLNINYLKLPIDLNHNRKINQYLLKIYHPDITLQPSLSSTIKNYFNEENLREYKTHLIETNRLSEFINFIPNFIKELCNISLCEKITNNDFTLTSIKDNKIFDELKNEYNQVDKDINNDEKLAKLKFEEWNDKIAETKIISEEIDVKINNYLEEKNNIDKLISEDENNKKLLKMMHNSKKKDKIFNKMFVNQKNIEVSDIIKYEEPKAITSVKYELNDYNKVFKKDTDNKSYSELFKIGNVNNFDKKSEYHNLTYEKLIEKRNNEILLYDNNLLKKK
jgi:hypothetical protein